jgi:hypothetical protein
MKPSVAIALIVCGALIVLAPPVSDYFERGDMFSRMGDLSRIASYLLGGLMILTAIGCSISKPVGQ